MTNEGIQLAMLLGAEDRTTAFEALLSAHERMVLRVAWRMLGSLDDARDAAQDVFLKLHKHFDRVDPARIESWLYRTTMNACYDILRRRKPAVALDMDIAVPSEAVDGIELAQRREMVAEALKQLPERERAVIVLREIEGVETAEVARIMGITETTVRSQVSMGKARLKRILEKMR